MTDNAELVERLRAQIPYQGKSAQAFLCHEAADAIAALQQESPRAEVAVKPLEWLDMSFPEKNHVEWLAHTPFGALHVYRENFPSDLPFLAKPFPPGPSNYATLEEAKAALIAHYEAKIAAALAPSLHQPAPEAGIAWRCFHCDEVFTDEQAARDHFGRDEGKLPACQIKAGAERSLVKALRRVEADNDDLMFRLQNECTDAAKAYHAQTARHHGQLLAAEEAGYERGLNDAAPAPEPQAPVPDGVTTKATVDFFDRGTRYLIEPGQFTILMAHGILSRVAPGVYQLATEAELLADPGSAGVNNPKPAAVLAVIRAALTAAPAQAPAPDGVTDEMVEKAIAAYDRIYKVEFPARGSWVTNHRDAMRAALTAAERSR